MNIIKSYGKENLSFKELQDMVGPTFSKSTRWMTWDQLAEIPSTRELFGNGKAVVVLLQIEGRHKRPVGHFILLLQFPGHIEHFDSYGLTIEQELSITHEKHLTRIFKDYRNPVVNNAKRLQTLAEDVNTCGRWIVARLMLQTLTLDAFLTLIHYFKINPDDLVTAMTFLLQLK